MGIGDTRVPVFYQSLLSTPRAFGLLSNSRNGITSTQMTSPLKKHLRKLHLSTSLSWPHTLRMYRGINNEIKFTCCGYGRLAHSGVFNARISFLGFLTSYLQNKNAGFKDTVKDS